MMDDRVFEVLREINAKLHTQNELFKMLIREVKRIADKAS